MWKKNMEICDHAIGVTGWTQVLWGPLDSNKLYYSFFFDLIEKLLNYKLFFTPRRQVIDKTFHNSVQRLKNSHCINKVLILQALKNSHCINIKITCFADWRTPIGGVLVLADWKSFFCINRVLSFAVWRSPMTLMEYLFCWLNNSHCINGVLVAGRRNPIALMKYLFCSLKNAQPGFVDAKRRDSRKKTNKKVKKNSPIGNLEI